MHDHLFDGRFMKPTGPSRGRENALRLLGHYHSKACRIAKPIVDEGSPSLAGLLQHIWLHVRYIHLVTTSLS